MSDFLSLSGQGDPPGRRGPLRNRAAGRQGLAGRDRQDHPRGRQAAQGRLPAAEQVSTQHRCWLCHLVYKWFSLNSEG